MRYLTVFCLFCFVFSCKKESLSDQAAILSFDVPGVTDPAFHSSFLDEANKIISLIYLDSIPSDSFPIVFSPEFTLSPGASALPASGTEVSFDNMEDAVTYQVTAEDGSEVTYFLILRNHQLPNADLEDWYITTGMNGKTYKEPGINKNVTAWATANSGTSIYSLYGTKPLTVEGNTIAEISTGFTTVIPITAGTLFTGRFDLDGAINNPTDPKQATIMGIPFTLRPSALVFTYTYKPGNHYTRSTLNDPDNLFGGFTTEEIPGTDKFAAYVILELRNELGTTEIARAELYSDVEILTPTRVSLPFEYQSSASPTHITVVFSSSKDGDLYTGSVGSKLTVDDIELTYEE
jgi:hypothetical protein